MSILSLADKRQIRTFFAILSLFFYCSLSHAALQNKDLPKRKGIEVGDFFIVHSALKTGAQFDSNIFLSRNDEKFDTIILLKPSVGFELPLREHNISLDYAAEINIFTINHNQNHLNHKIRGLGEFNFTNFKVTLDEVYYYFTDRAGSEDVNRIKQQTSKFRTGVSAQYDQLGFDVGYTLGIHDYLSKQALFGTMTYQDKDRFLNIFDAQVSYRFLPKTSFLLETYLGFINYNSSKSSDSVYTETLVGLRGDLTKDFTINLKGGLRYQYYRASELTVDNDFLSGVARGSISYYFTDDDIINLNVERSIYESTYNDMNYYNVNLLGLDYTHKFSNKISGSLFGSYQLNLYPAKSTEDGRTAKRVDNFFGGGLLLRYDIRKWLSLQAKYEYKQRNSNFLKYNYSDHLVTLEGTVGF